MKNKKQSYSYSRIAQKTLLLAALPLSFVSMPISATTASNVPNTVATKTANIVSSVKKLNPTTVEIRYTNGNLLLADFYGPNIVRLFQDNKGGIVRNPKAQPPAKILVKQPRKILSEGLTLNTENNNYTISSGTLTLKVKKNNGEIYIIDHSGKEARIVAHLLEPANISDKQTTLTFEDHPNEYFYGGGVQNGRFSHKGKTILIHNSNNWVDGGVASPTPFYWSTAGYGILWHTFKPGSYDFGQTEKGKVLASHKTDYLDVFLFTGEKPTDLLNGFYQLTGHPILLPKFGFYEGHLNAYNRDYWKEVKEGGILFEDGKHYKESQKNNGGTKESLNGEKNNYLFSARAAIDRYFNNDMPLGWFLPNDGYGAGYGQTSTLDGNIENLRQFGKYARQRGVQIGLWTQSDLHPKKGVEPLLQRDIVKEVRDAGVRVLKTDVAWVGAGYSFGLNGVSDVGEIMPYYGNNARPFIISLDGWAGTQRYAGIWSGDQTGGDWEYIRFHIPTFIGSGLSGQPNITNDLDGIFGGRNLPVNIRDFEWKTFTPMELNMDGWGANPKYPSALGEPATSINRSYLKLKSMLLPYTYTIAREAVEGKPIIRALFLDYPNAYTLSAATQYEFLYGPSLLVAPIYKSTRMDAQGNDIRNGIYLPEGRWFDYFNGQEYEGEKIINNFNAPIWKLPVFVKAGAIIPMTHPNNTPDSIRNDYRAYELYPYGETSFTQYDDDGKTQAYLYNKAVRNTITSTVKGNLLNVVIGKAKGNYKGYNPEKQTELFINVSEAPSKVSAKLGNKKLKLRKTSSLEDYNRNTNVYFYDAAPNLNKFATPGTEFAKQTITKNPQLRIKTAVFNVNSNNLNIEVKGFVLQPENKMLQHEGILKAPKVTFPDARLTSNIITPEWDVQPSADYYEIEFEGQIYSTIRDNFLEFEHLQPKTEYTFRVRAINKDHISPWTTAKATTKADPYQWAIKDIKAQSSCSNQPGQNINKLFDGDQKSNWHTRWGKTDAVPFTLDLDLGSVSMLHRIQYIPRKDAGNGTLLEGTWQVSTDRQHWTKPETFKFARNGEVKEILCATHPKARYMRMHITNAVGGYGSGNEMYIFKVPGTESMLQGDINRDKRIDENDLTSYMNYTGLRQIDSDFDYVKIGDINNNGVIDAYDISVVSTMLDGGVHASVADKVAGKLLLTPNKQNFKTGDEILLTVTGKDLKRVNGLSFGLPYNPNELKYEGLELKGMKDMVNLTYDRLHSNGQKELFPCFVNRGNNFLIEDGVLFIVKFKAKKDGKWNIKPIDGLLVDRNLGTTTPF